MTETEFVDVVRAESGLSLSTDDLRTRFDDLPGWDSVQLLKVLSALETERGITLPIARLLEARCLGDLHDAVVAA
jgi:acyl carrier protein